MALGGGVRQAQRGQAGLERLVVAQVPRPARLQPFLQHEPQPFAQGVDHRDRRGVVVEAVARPSSAATHRQVEIPALHLRLALADRLDGARAERHRRQARRTAQALLRATVNRVDLPGVQRQRHAAQRRDRVDEQQRVELVAQLAELLRSAARRRSRSRRGRWRAPWAGPSAASRGSGCRSKTSPHGRSSTVTSAPGPARPPRPCAGRRSPSTQTTILSPGSSRLTKHVSMPAMPVALTGNVSGFLRLDRPARSISWTSRS